MRQLSDGASRRWATLLVLFVLTVVLFGAFAVDHVAAGVHIAQGTVVGSGPSPSGPSG